MSSEPLISEEDAARRLEVHQSTLVRWIKNGDGPPHYLIGSRRRYREGDLERWLRECRVHPGSPAA